MAIIFDILFYKGKLVLYTFIAYYIEAHAAIHREAG